MAPASEIRWLCFKASLWFKKRYDLLCNWYAREERAQDESKDTYN